MHTHDDRDMAHTKGRKESINCYMTDIARCAYEAGMIFAGFNEDGQFEFMGTEIQWRRFRDLVSDSEVRYA
jgi:hypothetical protein